MTDIQSSVDADGAITRLLKVTVPAPVILDATNKAYSRLQPQVHLKGFRKGKAPRAVLEREYGQRVLQEVLEEVIGTTCGEAIEKHELDVVAQPRLMDQNYEAGNDLSYEVRVEVRPEVKLGKYKKRKLVRKVVRITDEKVEEMLGSLRERMAVLETEEERVNVQGGDVVTMDMFGFHDGEPVPGASGEGMQVEVGANRLGEDFETQLVGVTRGLRTPIEVTYPEDHGNQNLAGKQIRFEVTVKEIKNKILPALDDSLAADLGLEDCDTLDGLRDRIREDLEQGESGKADQRLREELVGELVDEHEFDVPESLLEEAVINRMREMGVPQDVTEEQVKEIRDALEPGAQRHVRARFLLDAIATAESIEATPEQVGEAVQQRVRQAGERGAEVAKMYRDHGRLAELAAALAREMAVEKVIEFGTVRDEETDESQVADHS